MAFKMLVESDDWAELQAAVVAKDATIADYKKALQNLVKEFALCVGSMDPNESPAYREAQKYT